MTAKSFQINDIFFYQFQCPEDDPLCDTEGDEYYNEEYNSPVLQPDPNMSKTELTLDNLDIPSLGKCQKRLIKGWSIAETFTFAENLKYNLKVS